MAQFSVILIFNLSIVLAAYQNIVGACSFRDGHLAHNHITWHGDIFYILWNLNLFVLDRAVILIYVLWIQLQAVNILEEFKLLISQSYCLILCSAYFTPH